MKQLIEKLVSLERQISTEKGEFSLFALFLREDAPNKWDLVASAPWIETGKKETLDYFAKLLRSSLDLQELLSLSRIVLIDLNNPGLKAIHKDIRVEHGIVEIKDSNFFGLDIKHAYIITSKKEDTVVKA